MTPVLAHRSRVDRAFERMYRRHVADVYHYALAVVRNPADAEDITQTTFLNAYRAFERGDHPKAPRNWLIAIAHNVCRQRFRQTARRPEEVEFNEDVGETLVEEEGPSASDIRRALGYLAFNQRAALVMRELEGRTYAEIAEILDISVSAVETLIFRARRALREQLEATLTCHEAEFAISRQLDGRLPRPERGPLRAHLRACAECATFARSQRAQRAAVRALAAVPVPASLASFFGGGTAAVGTGIAVKAVAAVAVAAVVGGVGYEGVREFGTLGPSTPNAAQKPSASPAAPAEMEPARLVAMAPGTTFAASAFGNARAGARGEKQRLDSSGKARGRPAAPPGRVKTKRTTGRTDAQRGRGSSKAKSTPSTRGGGHDGKAGKKSPPSKEDSQPPLQQEPPGQIKVSPLPPPPPLGVDVPPVAKHLIKK